MRRKLPITKERKLRNLIAIDETVVKANKKKYYVYSSCYVERNKLILMRVYTTKLPDHEILCEVLNTARTNQNS